jgi:hypothetical protein
MKRYARLIGAFCIGAAVLVSTMASIHFLQTWLPANGFQVSKKVFMFLSLGALGAALGLGAKLCLNETRKIETSKSS